MSHAFRQSRRSVRPDHVPTPIYEALEPRRLLVAGFLDGGFGGGDGYVVLDPFTDPFDTHTTSDGTVHDVWPYTFSPTAIAEDASGRILFGGTRRHWAYSREALYERSGVPFPALARLLANGAVDSTWGENGARTDLPFNFVNDLAALPNGEFLVAGDYGERGDDEPLQPMGTGLFRVGAAGGVTRIGPPSGGVGGQVYDVHYFQSGPDTGRALVLGQYTGPSDASGGTVSSRLAVWLSESDGTMVPGAFADFEELLGSGFDDPGYHWNAFSTRQGLAVGEGGEVYVRLPLLMPVPGAGQPHMFIRHVRLDLTRDQEFRSLEPRADWGEMTWPDQQIGTVGDIELEPTESSTGHSFLANHFGEMAVDAQGRLLLGGGWKITGRNEVGNKVSISEGIGVVRIDPQGNYDPAWGNGGVVAYFDIGTYYGLFTPLDLYLLPDGKILGVDMGGSLDGSRGVGVFRMMPDGTPDESFATGSGHGPGRNVFEIAPPSMGALDNLAANPHVSSSTLTHDGDLLVAGRVSTGYFAFQYFIGRVDLNGDGALPDDDGDDDDGGGDGSNPWDLGIAAALSNEDGLDVLQVAGTSLANRMVISSLNGNLTVLTGSAGSESVIPIMLGEEHVSSLPLAQIDRIEVLGFGGNDELRNDLGTAFSGFVTLYGGLGNDTLAGSGRYDRLFGDDGDDSLVAGDGDQLLFGGAGNDTLIGGNGRDAIWAGEGNDLLGGGAGDDFLEGGPGNDSLLGDSGDDTLVGHGNDSLIGGDGAGDVLWLRDAPATVASLAERIATNSTGTMSLHGLEHVLGGDEADEITGDVAQNMLIGGGGDDTIFGLDGKDTLIGGLGADRLDGGDDWDLLLDLDAMLGDTNPDVLVGGGGFDMALFSSTDDETSEIERLFSDIDDLLDALA